VKTKHFVDAVKEERIKHEEEIILLQVERDDIEKRYEELEGIVK
jgi:hypothetical protein